MGANHFNVAANIILLAASTTANAEGITPWSENRPETPASLPENLADKNVRLLNPFAAPDLYYELYDNAAERVTITDPQTKETENYELVSNKNNPDSSSHFKVIRNPETGHYILIGKGMDLIGRDEGAGWLGVLEDKNQHESAENGCITDQVLDGEKAYLELLQNPAVKSIEVIGYSIGSIPANYLASVYDAKTTNIADLGVPAPVDATFNTCAHGLFPGAHGEFAQNLNDNVTGLELRLDAMGGSIGEVGTRFGKQIVLDEESINLMGWAHIPAVYADSARKLHNAPKTDSITVTPDKQFQPF